MKKTMWLAWIALISAALACSIFIGGPDYPATPIAASTEGAQSLQVQISQALATGTASGQVTLHITEQQLTSYLSAYLQSNPNPVLTDPQVQLQDGRLKLYGKIQEGVFVANASITMTVSVDAQGQPQLAVTQEDFGPYPAPQGLNDALSGLAEEALAGSLGPAATGFRLESISIEDGVMTVTGRVR